MQAFFWPPVIESEAKQSLFPTVIASEAKQSLFPTVIASEAKQSQPRNVFAKQRLLQSFLLCNDERRVNHPSTYFFHDQDNFENYLSVFVFQYYIIAPFAKPWWPPLHLCFHVCHRHDPALVAYCWA